VPQIYHEDAPRLVEEQLRGLLTRCNMLLGAHAAGAHLRANVFIPVQRRLCMVASANMDGDPDNRIEFASFDMGLTGQCYRQRSRLVCNLKELAALQARKPQIYEQLFGIPPYLQARLRKDRTWLASMPIFDPYELRVLQGAGVTAEVPRITAADAGIDITGPILGTLNIDAGWDYDALDLQPEPAIHCATPLVQSILALMQSVSISVARILAAPMTPV
jgi:hypothetical protein